MYLKMTSLFPLQLYQCTIFNRGLPIFRSISATTGCPLANFPEVFATWQNSSSEYYLHMVATVILPGPAVEGYWIIFRNHCERFCHSYMQRGPHLCQDIWNTLQFKYKRNRQFIKHYFINIYPTIPFQPTLISRDCPFNKYSARKEYLISSYSILFLIFVYHDNKLNCYIHVQKSMSPL